MLITTTLNLIAALTLTAQAAPRTEAAIDLICVSEFPTTSFFVAQQGDQVQVRVLHHNGAQYAPFLNNLLTPNDMPLMQERADFVSSLSDQWIFTFPRSSCNADGPMFFQCVGDGSTFESNGKTIRPWGFTVTDVVQKTIWGTYTHKNLSLNMESGDPKKNYEVTMNFQPDECVPSAQLNKNPKLKERVQKLTKARPGI